MPSVETMAMSQAFVKVVKWLNSEIDKKITCLVPFSKYSEVLVKKRQFFIPLPFNLHDHIKPLRIFFSKIFIQSVRVPQQLRGQKPG